MYCMYDMLEWYVQMHGNMAYIYILYMIYQFLCVWMCEIHRHVSFFSL